MLFSPDRIVTKNFVAEGTIDIVLIWNINVYFMHICGLFITIFLISLNLVAVS